MINKEATDEKKVEQSVTPVKTKCKSKPKQPQKQRSLSGRQTDSAKTRKRIKKSKRPEKLADKDRDKSA